MNEQQPKEYDLVLGNQNKPQPGDLVLGGIAGIKRRLESQSINKKLIAIKEIEYGEAGLDLLIDVFRKDENIEVIKAVLQQMIKYGDRGIDFVIEQLYSYFPGIQKLAIEVLINCPQEKAKLALRGNTDLVGIYIKRGTNRLKRKDYEGAIADFSEVLDYTFEYAELYNRRAFCYQKLQQYQLAINDLSRIIELTTNPGKIHGVYYNRGSCYFSLKELASAIADFSQAIKIKPDFFQAYLFRGILYEELGDTKKAEENFNLGKQLKPKNK